MKDNLTIFFLLICSVITAQNKDRRAALDIQGRVDEISVSPDEKIWLVSAISQTYYTNNIDSNWHYGKSLAVNKDEFSVENPFLNRISFFNKDTAIMTGWISLNKDIDKRNGLYLTKDGGRNWLSIDFGGDSWIYHACVDKMGHAWIGGSSGDIYYSHDFGQQWEKLNSPYTDVTRMKSIFMLNITNGISGALGNSIYTTNNNWKTYKKIPTPFDQEKYDGKEGSSDDRIGKIVLWNNYIVVNQQGRFYYTDTSNVNWKLFPIKIIDFELDTESEILYAISDSMEAISFSSPTEYKKITSTKIAEFPVDMKVVDHSMFIYTNNYGVYKIDSKGITHSNLYTTDKRISMPENSKKFKNITWGITGNQIYLAEDTSLNWYREYNLDFRVADFKLLNDSTAILWDGQKNNYIYSLHDHTPKLYFPKKPLENFLTAPLKTISISAGSEGCFHYYNDEVRYEKKNDSILVSTGFSKYYRKKQKKSRYKHNVNSASFLKVLSEINSNLSGIPTLKDFHINENDKQNYLELVDSEIKNRDSEDISRMKKIDKVFYDSIPKMLDTMNSSIVAKVLDEPEYIISTTSYWFTIQLINQSNDTLNINRRYYENTKAWNMPWKFEYKEQNFNCYNIEFSKFVNSCIPDNFLDKGVLITKN